MGGGPITFQGFVEISIFEIIPCMHLPFIVHSCPFMFLSCSFHWYSCPFIFLSCSFQCAFMSSHIPFTCTHSPFILHSCPFISFLKLWKGPMAWPGNRVPQNDRERERERQRETERETQRERESKRERGRDRASWMPNSMVTAGNRAPQVEFPSSVLPVL